MFRRQNRGRSQVLRKAICEKDVDLTLGLLNLDELPGAVRWPAPLTSGHAAFGKHEM